MVTTRRDRIDGDTTLVDGKPVDERRSRLGAYDTVPPVAGVTPVGIAPDLAATPTVTPGLTPEDTVVTTPRADLRSTDTGSRWGTILLAVLAVVALIFILMWLF